MKFLSILSLFIMMATMQSCNFIVANSNYTTENRNTGSFNEVELDNFCDVMIEKDTAFSISISSPDNVIGYIKTEVSGQTLRIYTPDGNNISMNNETATVHIKMPDPLNKISIHGSGNINVLSSFSHLSDIRITGSGNINASIPFSPSSLTSNISGSGNINLAGITTTHTMGISGSGNISAKDMVTSIATISISGSGNVLTTVNTTLNATISGSGNIEYWGNPTVNANISGSGQLIHH